MNSHRATTPTTEPVITVGSISALITAVLALIVVLGVPLPDGFEAALIGVVVAAGPIVGAFIARRYVTPNGRVVEREDHGSVVAGEGHEDLPAGVKIRDVHDG